MLVHWFEVFQVGVALHPAVVFYMVMKFLNPEGIVSITQSLNPYNFVSFTSGREN